MSSTDPNQSLYIKGLPEKIRVEGNHHSFKTREDVNHVSNLRSTKLTLPRSTEIKASLYTLFLTYGEILDIVIMKKDKMRGQAFVVFDDIASATAALKSLNGFSFYEKNLVSLSCCRIVYLRTNRESTPCTVLSKHYFLTLVHSIQ